MVVVLVPVGVVGYKGYLVACSKNYDFNLVIQYRIYQLALCFLWILLSIVSTGCFDGWKRISQLKDKDTAVKSFCVFLTIVQALSYTIACLIGIICFFQASSVLSLLTIGKQYGSY